MHRVQRLKDASMMASKFRDAEFSVYQKRKENQRAWKRVDLLQRKMIKRRLKN